MTFVCTSISDPCFGCISSHLFLSTKVSHRPEKTADAAPGMPPVFNAPYDYVGTPGNLSQDEAFNRMNLQRRNQTTWLGRNVRKKIVFGLGT